VNPSYRFDRLSRIAKRRILKLRTAVRPLGLPASPEADRLVAWAMIEALNVWAGFLRSYYLSATGHARTMSGTKITLSIVKLPNFQAALIFAIKQKNPKFRKTFTTRRDEPAWHNTNDFLGLLRKVGASNISKAQAGLAYRSTFFDFLPTIRNFYAHRCDETFRKAANVGIKLGLSAIPNLHATEIMCSNLPKRPQNIATDWLDDIANVIDLLCQ
jgi:hypothetical protein